MTRFVVTAVALLAAACNPARVDPPPSVDKVDEARVSKAARTAPPSPEKSVAEEEPAFARMGQVRCVTRARWAVRDCTAGVRPDPDGGATLTIFHPEGRSRDIAFDGAGRATGIATAEADGSDRQPFAARRAGAATIVTLGPERYEIPDALLAGR